MLNKNTNVRVDHAPVDENPKIRVTYIGAATVLLEIDGLRIVTDPVLDPAGTRYRLGRTGLMSYTNRQGPAVVPTDLGRIDVGLVSHDQHKDNLDRAGRDALAGVPTVATTVSGARRLIGRFGLSAVGLAPWESISIATPSGARLVITATPARHGPWWMGPLVGDVIGFVLAHSSWGGKVLYISGDTVLYSGLEEIARRYAIGLALMHVGAGRFAATGPIRYSFDAAELAAATALMKPDQIVPIHFEGWSHFSEGRAEIEARFAGGEHAERLHWLPPGIADELVVGPPVGSRGA